MTNWNLEGLKLLKEHGIFGDSLISGDGYWRHEYNKGWSFSGNCNTKGYLEVIPAYRKDKLEAKLPEKLRCPWIWSYSFDITPVFDEISGNRLTDEKLSYLVDEFQDIRNNHNWEFQIKFFVKACCQLLVLLKKEGVE